MKITIVANPLFQVPLTLGAVAVLMKLSSLHYDATCRAASMPGQDGFIYGWQNSMTFLEENPKRGQSYSGPPAIQATWRQLDFCLKIMEYLHALTLDEKEIAEELRRQFMGAFVEANRVLPEWVAVYDGDVGRQEV